MQTFTATSSRAFAVVFISLSILAAKAFAAEPANNELADELSKLGVDGGGGLQDMIQKSVDDAMARQRGGAGGAQGEIPLPQPPLSSSSWHDDDDYEDDEPNYLEIAKMKDMYPKKGDAKRLKTRDFDERVFNGNQEMTIIHFYSKWCKECQLHAPSYRAAAKRYRDDPKVQLFVVNQESNYDLSARFDLDPNDSTFFYAIGSPQVDGDLKMYEGEVSFAGMLQFIGTRGEEMIKVEKFERQLYDEDSAGINVGLNWDNFNATVFDPKKNVMVKFYAPWSEFSQIDQGNYTVLGARMGQSNPNDVVIAAINTDKHERLADRFDVQQLPCYWFFNRSATEDTHAFKYTGDHTGALVIEELEPYITSDGAKVPPGMQDEGAIHPKPWPEIEKAMKERNQKEQEKDDAERKEQETAAAERREKFEAKKKKLAEKKAAKQKKKEEKKEL